MMYVDLIKRLRILSKIGTRYGMACLTMADAADAIEELQRKYIRERNAAVELTGILASGPRWIPVTELLPEPYTAVLLYGGEEVCEGYMHIDKRFTVNASRFPNSPTHWMLLPSPPEEEI